jgi:hypothetical protein
MTHVSRWQRLVGKAKCNHRLGLRLRPTRHPAGSVSSEWPSAITPLEGVVNDPCSEVAASGRKGQVQSPPAAPASANQPPRWQCLIGMAKCNPTVGGRGQ